MTNEILNDGLGVEPINFAAACLLFKSPWWAKAPQEAKHILRQCKVEVSVFVDLTKPAPAETTNRIGERCHRATVIGFAHKTRNLGKVIRTEGRLPGVRSRKGGDKLAFGLRGPGGQRENVGLRPVWYLLFDNGMIQLITSKTLNKWQRLGEEEWMKYHYPNERDMIEFNALGKVIGLSCRE